MKPKKKILNGILFFVSFLLGGIAGFYLMSNIGNFPIFSEFRIHIKFAFFLLVVADLVWAVVVFRGYVNLVLSLGSDSSPNPTITIIRGLVIGILIMVGGWCLQRTVLILGSWIIYFMLT